MRKKRQHKLNYKYLLITLAFILILVIIFNINTITGAQFLNPNSLSLSNSFLVSIDQLQPFFSIVKGDIIGSDEEYEINELSKLRPYLECDAFCVLCTCYGTRVAQTWANGLKRTTYAAENSIYGLADYSPEKGFYYESRTFFEGLKSIIFGEDDNLKEKNLIKFEPK